MQNKTTKYIIIAFVVGFLMACVSLAAGGFTFSNGGHPSIACSSDGKYVYIVDLKNFFRSEDYGNTWKAISANNINP